MNLAHLSLNLIMEPETKFQYDCKSSVFEAESSSQLEYECQLELENITWSFEYVSRSEKMALPNVSSAEKVEVYCSSVSSVLN